MTINDPETLRAWYIDEEGELTDVHDFVSLLERAMRADIERGGTGEIEISRATCYTCEEWATGHDCNADTWTCDNHALGTETH